MTIEQFKSLNEERKSTYLLLIEKGEEYGNILLERYASALQQQIDYATYDNETEIQLLQEEFKKGLASHNDFLAREEDIDFDLFLNFIKHFLKTINLTFLYQFIEAFIGEEPLTEQPTFINGRKGFFHHKNYLNEDPIITFAEPLIKILGVAFFSRGKLPFIKSKIKALHNPSEPKIGSENIIQVLKEEPIEESIPAFEMKQNYSKANLHYLLKEQGLIGPETEEQNFVNIFSRGNIKAIKPFIWKETEVLLAYLLDKLKPILEPLSYHKRYAIAAQCFKKSNGKSYKNAQLARASNNYQNSPSGVPKAAALIDKILNSIEAS